MTPEGMPLDRFPPVVVEKPRGGVHAMALFLKHIMITVR
jgi:hypothetical protein